jgi:DUF1009 family protein
MFSGALTILEGWGHPVLGAHEISPDLLAGPEFKSSIAVDDRAREAIDVGLRLLTTLSPYDMGQATVVSGQRVLAIEGPEGTDRMLKRVRGINQVHFFRKKRNGGVLIKTAKMGQDLRVDMPTIGPRTVIEAARAGLGGIAVGAGSTDRARSVGDVEPRRASRVVSHNGGTVLASGARLMAAERALHVWLVAGEESEINSAPASCAG